MNPRNILESFSKVDNKETVCLQSKKVTEGPGRLTVYGSLLSGTHLHLTGPHEGRESLPFREFMTELSIEVKKLTTKYIKQDENIM